MFEVPHDYLGAHVLSACRHFEWLHRGQPGGYHCNAHLAVAQPDGVFPHPPPQRKHRLLAPLGAGAADVRRGGRQREVIPDPSLLRCPISIGLGASGRCMRAVPPKEAPYGFTSTRSTGFPFGFSFEMFLHIGPALLNAPQGR